MSEVSAFVAGAVFTYLAMAIPLSRARRKLEEAMRLLGLRGDSP